jgi:hypothetical protein
MFAFERATICASVSGISSWTSSISRTLFQNLEALVPILQIMFFMPEIPQKVPQKNIASRDAPRYKRMCR